MIRKIFCIAIITLGSGLEIYFYVFRFIGDGINLPIAISAAVALELLLAFSVYQSQFNKIFLIIVVTVSIYATIQTSAGQTFSLMSHDSLAGVKVVTDANKIVLAEHEKNIERLGLEADSINKQLSSLTKLENRAVYAKSVYYANNRLDKINKDIMKSINVISDLSGKQSESEKLTVHDMSVYDFYASIPKWSHMDKLKFIFHTFLSVLLTLMTPIGILSWHSKSDKKVKTKKITKEQIDNFVYSAWYKVRGKTGMNILPELSYNEIMQRNNFKNILGVYPELYNVCISVGLITDKGTIIEQNEEIAKEKILLFFKKNK